MCCLAAHTWELLWDSCNCQTSGASPAKPGGLPFVLVTLEPTQNPKFPKNLRRSAINKLRSRKETPGGRIGGGNCTPCPVTLCPNQPDNKRCCHPLAPPPRSAIHGSKLPTWDNHSAAYDVETERPTSAGLAPKPSWGRNPSNQKKRPTFLQALRIPWWVNGGFFSLIILKPFITSIYGGERGIRTLSHAILRLPMPPNAL